MQLGTESSVVPFTSANFSAREAYRPAYDRVAEVLTTVLDFQTCIDVGSGQGFLIDAMLAYGIDACGIEMSRDALGYASEQAAVRTNVGNVLWGNTSIKFDLVCCIEVAEHIDPEHSARLVAKLTEFAKDTIYFTAASPYQPGHGHINCRPATDWIYWFSRCGYKLDIEKTTDIRARLGALEAAPWIAQNTMLFTKEN